MVMVSLPDGTLSPNSTSAMASAASLPPNHTFMMAGTCLLSHVITVGRPEKLRSTTGLPVATSSLSRDICMSGRVRSERLDDSPLISELSPMAHTITSASRATLRASALMALSSPRFIVLPNSASFCICASAVRLHPWA